MTETCEDKEKISSNTLMLTNVSVILKWRVFSVSVTRSWAVRDSWKRRSTGVFPWLTLAR